MKVRNWWWNRLIILYMFIPKFATGQDTLMSYFSYFAQEPDINTTFVATILKDNYNYVIGERGLNEEHLDLTCDKINFMGELIWTKVIDGSNNELKVILSSSSVQLDSNGNIIIPYTVFNWNASTNKMAVIKMDTSGEVLDSKRYNHPTGYNNAEIRDVKQTPDGGLLLMGNQQLIVNGEVQAPHILVRKVDSVGNLVWAREYYPEPENRTVAFSICPSPDGNYFIGGAVTDIPFDGTGFLHYLIKINEQGDTLWTKTYGMPVGDEDDNNNSALAIQEYNDTCVLVSSTFTNDYLVADLNMVVYNFYKLNNQGVIYDLVQDTIQLREYYRPFLLEPDGSFTVIRNTYNENDFLEAHFFKLGENFDSLYRQRLGYENTIAYLCTDIDKCPDGGYIVTGYTSPEQPQRGFLWKIDSLGRQCSSWGCDSLVIDSTTYISYLQDFDAGRYKISTSPNPCKDHFILSYQLPQEAENVWWRLYDINGIERRSLRLLDASGEREVTLRHCDPGLYLWRLSIGNRVVENGKLIVKDE